MKKITVLLLSVAAETRRCMENLGRTLKDHGYHFGDLVRVTVYLADMKDYNEMNSAYREYFPDGNFPARLRRRTPDRLCGLRTEISCVAYKV